MLKKRISIIQRRTDLTPERFDAHWAGPHVPIVRSLPGIQYYVQHHLVGEQADVRAAGIDGIAEVIYEAPAQQASNKHFSEEQSKDELEFVAAMTAIPIAEPVQHYAPYSIWIVSRDDLDVFGFEVTAATHVWAERRDDAQPVMTREHLGTEPEPTRTYVVLGFETLDAAMAAYARMSSMDEVMGAPRTSLRIALTESVPQL